MAGRVLVSALAIIPGPDETVTFVRQEHGPDAGWWLLPGGKVAFGEPIEEAARREAAEESGCAVGELLLTGAYEIFGPDHHYVVWAYRGKQVLRPPSGFPGHHVTGVRAGPLGRPLQVAFGDRAALHHRGGLCPIWSNFTASSLTSAVSSMRRPPLWAPAYATSLVSMPMTWNGPSIPRCAPDDVGMIRTMTCGSSVSQRVRSNTVR
jgi:8-oxo-dGTP pyrophosphatase MutT (NUDIX family)